MAETGYPVFEGGMTLTKDDLNLLREFLDLKDGVLGRLIGFGIACGLDVTVGGGQLRVRPGLAVDQDGRGILLDGGTVVPTSTPFTTEKFAFLDPAQGGVTPVLVLAEWQDEIECDDESCVAHAPLRKFEPRVVLARGRLKTGLDAFTLEPLLDVTPLTVNTKGEVVGDFTKVRDAILKRLRAVGVSLSTAAESRLAGLTLSGIAAVKVYRAAFLNEVLFAAIELMRCRALHAGGCVRDEPVPGVALGWLAPTGAWDCRYGHRFEPNTGLVTALLGGSCGDPCELALQRLDALLTSYVEPATPPSGGGGTRPDPKVPDIHICGPKSRYGPMLFDACRLEILPEERFDHDLWKLYWYERPTLFPEKDLPRPQDWFTDPMDRYKDVLGLDPVFGTNADRAKTVIEEVLGGHLTQPDVRVLTEDEALGLAGFEPHLNVGVGDAVILVRDSANRVVKTGRVTSQHFVRNAGAAIQEAQNVAGDAASAVEHLQDNVTATVTSAVTSQLADVRTQLQGTFTTQLSALRTELTSQFSTDLAQLTTLQKDFATFKTQLQVQSATIKSLTDQQFEVNRRFDLVLSAQNIGGGGLTAGVEGIDTGQLVEILSPLRDAVAAAADEEQAVFVREKLEAADSAVRMIDASGTQLRVTSMERNAMFDALGSIADAAELAGAPSESVDAARQKIAEYQAPR